MSNAAAARRFYEEVMASGDPAGLEDLVAEKFVNHAAISGTPEGREGAKAQLEIIAAGFSDQSYEIHKLLCDGDEVALYCTWHGTHRGDFMGIPATQKKIASRQVHILRFDGEGKVAEHWAVRDDLTMLRQMGIAPS
jgi:steroid delta-isomerase-like uncharacterized protein